MQADYTMEDIMNDLGEGYDDFYEENDDELKEYRNVNMRKYDSDSSSSSSDNETTNKKK